MGYLAQAGVFLVKTLFGLYILAVMLRFLLQTARADFRNPIARFLITITNPPLIPLRRVIPGLFRVDLATVLLLFALQALEVALIGWMRGAPLQIGGVAAVSVVELLSLLVNVYFFSILIQAVLSWVNPGTYHPATALLHDLNEPLLRPARRLIPPIGGLDLSPLVVLIALQLISILVIAALEDWATRLMLG